MFVKEEGRKAGPYFYYASENLMLLILTSYIVTFWEILSKTVGCGVRLLSQITSLRAFLLLIF
jgi:hypothetical protein